MDIGKIIEVGTRDVPTYVPGPTMVPVRQDPAPVAPEKQREEEPEKVE